jgi:uncharacterized RDD family membrane protein YckC
MVYAGFWRRFGAYVVDSIILTIGLGILLFVLSLIGIPIFESAEYAAETADMSASISAGANLSPVASIILFVVGLLYFPLLESSSLQATPGKLALGIKVTDLQGNRIGFGRALGRNLAKIVSAIILYIGFIMAGFTARKQALHDMIAGCLVVAKSA